MNKNLNNHRLLNMLKMYEILSPLSMLDHAQIYERHLMLSLVIFFSCDIKWMKTEQYRSSITKAVNVFPKYIEV